MDDKVEHKVPGSSGAPDAAAERSAKNSAAERSAENATTNAALTARRLKATPRGVGIVTPIFAARAENALLWDVEGKRYIDFGGGIAVQNTGHRHPRVMAAVREQLERFTHTCYAVTPYESYVRLAERLNALVPGDFEKKTLFFSTGAEATENAVKIARSFTGRPAVIAMNGAFHGRTLLAMALTGKIAPYKQGFGPFPPDVYHLPYPSPLHGVTVADTLKALDTLFKVEVEPKRVAALLIEPVQGEGGFYVAPKELLRALRQRCDEHGIVLVIDEVQTGFCRTGTLFALEQYDVEADLVPMAKSIGGGFPLSAVTGRAAIMDAPQPGGLGGTYAGNPVAIAAAHAILDVIVDEDIPRRAVRLGEKLVQHLKGLQQKHSRIAEVRGLGAMVAIELMERRGHDVVPDADATKRLLAAALERGLLLLSCGMSGNVIRFLFPLTIEDALFDEALAILDASCAAALS